MSADRDTCSPFGKGVFLSFLYGSWYFSPFSWKKSKKITAIYKSLCTIFIIIYECKLKKLTLKKIYPVTKLDLHVGARMGEGRASSKHLVSWGTIQKMADEKIGGEAWCGKVFTPHSKPLLCFLWCLCAVARLTECIEEAWGVGRQRPN